MVTGHHLEHRHPTLTLPRFWAVLLTAALLVTTATGLCAAEATASSPAEQHRADIEAAMTAAQKVQVKGPAEITLKDQAKLRLPAGYVWIPEPQAGQVMKAWGNQIDEREIGLVFPTADDQDWVVVAQYEPSGYIKDDDAKNWKIDEMFKSFKEGTEAANEDRRQRGFPELEIVDWVERPAYDATAHRLIWSMSSRHKGAEPGARQSINYNTYALGREGYITLNMITGTDTIAREKGFAQLLIGGIDFNEGKRYADFNAGTDKTAEYGLAALVGGIAAKKLGFFALAAGLFAKFAKVIAVAVIGGGAVLRKLFGKKNPPDTPA
jgi:uncharacterized membrane-anchored protein